MIFFALLGFMLLFSCQSQEEVDALYFNGKVYTVDDVFQITEAFAIKDGKFVATGNTEALKKKYRSADMVDLQGKAVYPGFIDGHAHFFRYSLGLAHADLTGTSSFEELVSRVVAHREKFPDSEWILGRGWDQNNWPGQQFPTKDTFDILFPETPLLLTRVDGHAALANQKALDLGGVDAKTSMVGGKVILEKGKMTGVLIDNAIKLVSSKVEDPNEDEIAQALMLGQANCFEVGLTSVVDAGLDRSNIFLMDRLQKEGSLKMKVYAMSNPDEENRKYFFDNGIYKTDFMHVRSFKIYGDGALGSRGACLVHPYHDEPENTGFLLATYEHFDNLAKEIYEKGFQMNTHCIGDSANRVILEIYGKYLPKDNDRRWRIEHAQVVTNTDLSGFGKYKVIPSVQPTHATSDMYWAGDRLGAERIKTAYAYQELLEQNGLLCLGSDFPVEDINPLYGFHSAVARKDANNYPEGGFQPENKISREDALRGMTIWAAYSQFEEGEKGSIEKGKWADFVVLEEDIMEIAEEKLRNVKVLATYINGQNQLKHP